MAISSPTWAAACRIAWLDPSACVGPEKSYYEPSHGSAPDIAGRGRQSLFNDWIGRIMLDKSFGMKAESDALWNAMQGCRWLHNRRSFARRTTHQHSRVRRQNVAATVASRAATGEGHGLYLPLFLHALYVSIASPTCKSAGHSTSSFSCALARAVFQTRRPRSISHSYLSNKPQRTATAQIFSRLEARIRARQIDAQRR